MSDDRFHFEIPRDNVRAEKFEKTGYSPSVDRINHSEHGLKLEKQTDNLIKVEVKKKDSKFTKELFLEIETSSSVSIKSQQLNIEKLGFEILSISKSNRTVGTAKIDKSKLKKFQKKLKRYINTNGSGKTYFSPIENIQPISPQSKIKFNQEGESQNEISIVINLYNVISSKELLAINAVIIENLRSFAKDVNHRSFSNGVSSIFCTVNSERIFSIAKNFSSVREIKKSSVFMVPQSTVSEKLPNPLVIERPVSDSVVCIIDTGISDANGIMGGIVTDRKYYLPKGSINCGYDHGTFVGSRCVFGDQIDSCLGTHRLQPYCKLLDVSVFGRNIYGQLLGPNEFGLKCVIEDTVIKYHRSIKVYNLSLGVDAAINDYEFSDTAKLLDYLSKHYKVLFVIAAGNIRNLLGKFPEDHFNNIQSRIGVPAESLLSLSVGSIAKYTSSISLSEMNQVSPFSRIGPGADSGIKPEVVAHGGNYILPYTFSPRGATYGIGKDGLRLAVDSGTSHAAPLIAQYAQRLFDLYPNSEPNLIKALLCHFTNDRNSFDGINQQPINCVGFGEPNIENAIKASENNAAFIYEGKIDENHYQIISFHIPKIFAENEDSKLRVRITVTYDPSVSPDNELEYSKSRISATLFKPTDQGMKSINISTQNKYNVPWNPILQFEKSFSRSYLTGKWDLRLRLFTRGGLDENYLQDYSVVIELIDDSGLNDVYNEIKNEFEMIYRKINSEEAA